MLDCATLIGSVTTNVWWVFTGEQNKVGTREEMRREGRKKDIRADAGGTEVSAPMPL